MNIQQIITSCHQRKDPGLDLSGQHLTSIPEEIFDLTHLQRLDLYQNQIAELPKEIGNLKALQRLSLSGNQIAELPKEIGNLQALQGLFLSGNQIAELPEEIGNLQALQWLNLSENRIAELPKEIGNLQALQEFYLDRNQIAKLPKEIGNLKALQRLYLYHNQIAELPKEIGNLKALQELTLSGNQIAELPEEIGNLKALQQLNLDQNRIKELPEEVGNLKALRRLDLYQNQIVELPKEIGNLKALQLLNLSQNRIAELPKEFARLTNLSVLYLDNNPLTSPPPSIISQGTKAVLSYLHEQLIKSQQLWESKLLIVGEGGVGKTQLLRRLRGKEFDPSVPTTHGIEIKEVPLEHPSEKNVTMCLNAWDFGGQQIYHATHQFFLTDRSLFLLVWNARLGYEQGKLYYWLDTIKSLAPESPVILVSTHIDERDVNLPLSDLKNDYPNIINNIEISNSDGRGMDELICLIAKSAAGLPLMGAEWPANWLDASNAIRTSKEKHILPDTLFTAFSKNKVSQKDFHILARWMHDLGYILYYPNDDELNDIVILKPQWVSEFIDKVLISEEVKKKAGIFTRFHMRELWCEIDLSMQDHFLRLMERFDLSYRTLENKEISLVVERLPLDPPDYAQLWNSMCEKNNCREISMLYKLGSVPAGIPTWFIARSHRFTTHTHWRNGALFSDGAENKHLALVQAYPNRRYVKLTVRGPNPHNFLALLKDGLELTLNRFPGLEKECFIPCPGHHGDPCSHEFKYDQLVKRLELSPPKYTIECAESTIDMDVRTLLFGLGVSTLDDVHRELKKSSQENTARYNELLELMQREFANLFRRDQSVIDSHCPNIFTLRPHSASNWKKTLIGQRVDLQLYCQAPGCWHPTKDGGLYSIDDPAKWLKAVAPYLSKLVALLKYVTPIAGPWVAIQFPAYEKLLKTEIKLTSELIKKLPDLKEPDDLKLFGSADIRSDPDRISGAPLRAIRQLLESKDPEQNWGGLRKILTPEGHYLWLCEHHAKEYLS